MEALEETSRREAQLRYRKEQEQKRAEEREAKHRRQLALEQSVHYSFHLLLRFGCIQREETSREDRTCET